MDFRLTDSVRIPVTGRLAAYPTKLRRTWLAPAA